MSAAHGISRRSVVLGAAWSVPVIAAAIATPLAAASVARTAISCQQLQNHGHGGPTGNDWWHVAYNDGTTEILRNGIVQSDPTLKALCGKKVHS